MTASTLTSTAPAPAVEYRAKWLAGRCWNGAERGSGTVRHAVPAGGHYTGPALCGKLPGRRSAGWCSLGENGVTGPALDVSHVTCGRCRKRLAAAN